MTNQSYLFIILQSRDKRGNVVAIMGNVHSIFTFSLTKQIDIYLLFIAINRCTVNMSITSLQRGIIIKKRKNLTFNQRKQNIYY